MEKAKDAVQQARKTRIEGSLNLQVKPLVKIKPHVKPVKPNKGDPDEVIVGLYSYYLCIEHTMDPLDNVIHV